jgi:hypothetical protein
MKLMIPEYELNVRVVALETVQEKLVLTIEIAKVSCND